MAILEKNIGAVIGEIESIQHPARRPHTVKPGVCIGADKSCIQYSYKFTLTIIAIIVKIVACNQLCLRKGNAIISGIRSGFMRGRRIAGYRMVATYPVMHIRSVMPYHSYAPDKRLTCKL